MNLGKEERIASARVPSQPNLCPHIEAKNITATDNENRSSSLNEGEVKKKRFLTEISNGIFLELLFQLLIVHFKEYNSSKERHMHLSDHHPGFTSKKPF
jgi:hypothetical protein